mmetsp:Transcript_2460/g.5178  ORF Transcript_2460/g.5178 Transcript_2460/m.5178 type:complete len:410 (-) Transcript_2460:67-1296(-)
MCNYDQRRTKHFPTALPAPPKTPPSHPRCGRACAASQSESVSVILREVHAVLRLTELGLSKRVEEGADDGNRGADDAERGDGCLEGDHRSDDDDNALDGVADGMCDWVHAAERKEGNFVVQVVEGAGHKGLLPQIARGGTGGEGRVDGGRNGGWRLEGKGDGQHEEEGEDGEHAVQVGLIHVLADTATHGLLGENATQSRRKVGAHRSNEAQPRERELLERSESHAADDGQEREVRDGRVEGSQEHGRKRRGDDRFGCLDDMRERHGTSAERHNSANVSTQMTKRDWDERLDVTSIQLWCLTNASRPEEEAVWNTHEKLEGGHRVGNWERVERLLVVDIVANVEQIPEREERTSRECLHQAIFLCWWFCSCRFLHVKRSASTLGQRGKLRRKARRCSIETKVHPWRGGR